MASAALSMRLARARRKASGSARTGGNAGFKIALHGDALKAAGEKRQRFIDDFVHVAGAGLRRGELRQRGELVDEGAQSADATQNDFAAFADDVGRVGLGAVKMPADALGGKRDGRERILDFVGDALRHFFPCQLALGAQKFGCVFDDQHVACLSVRELKAGAGNGQMNGAAAGVEFDLGGCCAHAMTAADEAGKVVVELGREQGLDVFAGVGGIVRGGP